MHAGDVVISVSHVCSLPTKSDKVTVNDRYMPTLGSGLIGTSVYGDGVYVNGLYNGKGG